MSCHEISAHWAAQQTKGLSLASTIRSALRLQRPPKDGAAVVRTLIKTFRYPRLGPGMMWETCAQKNQSMGGEVFLGRKVIHCRFNCASTSWTVTARTCGGLLEKFHGGHLISTTSIWEFVSLIEPRPPEAVQRSAIALRYWDFLTVGLIFRE